MRHMLTTVVLLTVLSAVPALASAAPAKAQTQPAAKSASKGTPASHATIGVVKSIDETTLVITRSGRKGGPMTFVVSPSTKREGTVEVGFPVSVRYHADGKNLVAMAITARPPKQQAARSTRSKQP